MVAKSVEQRYLFLLRQSRVFEVIDCGPGRVGLTTKFKRKFPAIYRISIMAYTDGSVVTKVLSGRDFIF